MLSTHSSVIWPLPCLRQPFDSPFLIIYPFLAKPRAPLMGRSECFQMFVYLLCGNYKRVYSYFGCLPVASFLGAGVSVAGVTEQSTPTFNESELPNKCETHPTGVVFFSFFNLWRLLPSWDFNNSCGPFKIHTYKVAGSRPRTTRLKGPKALTVRQISGVVPHLFTLLVQRYPFHLQLSLLRDGLLRLNLIHVEEAGRAWPIY